MKWSLVVCLFVCLTRFCEGGALRCPPGVLDPSCTEERKEIETQDSSNSEQTEAQCLAGSEWESNCHYCRCSDSGVAECLKQAVCDRGVFAEPMLCKPNTTFQRDCNTCVCLENGLGLCTLEFCRRTNIKSNLELLEESDKDATKKSTSNVIVPNITLSRKVRSFTTEMPKTCQPGQEFRMDCNKCLCDNRGHDFSCTRIDCNALNNNHHQEARTKREVSDPIEMKCSPGSVFDRDCNVCRCTSDGDHATCTLKRCTQNNEPESEVHTPDSDLGFRCNPGEQFKRDCNDCTCSADGKSIFCTLVLCDQDLAVDI